MYKDLYQSWGNFIFESVITIRLISYIYSILLFIVGIAWILILPYDGYNKRTYISENALLPGQVNEWIVVPEKYTSTNYYT